MKTLGFGIIGCGVIADWHARAIEAVDGAKLIGAASANIDHAKTFCWTHGVVAFSSVEELLRSEEIDVVCICTPSGLHAELTIAAAEHGKHVVVEKPMALSTKDADAMIAACETAQVKLMVISQLRYSEAVSHLKEAVETGTLGRLVTGDVFMKFYRAKEYYASASWRGTYALDGGGALMNQGIHGLDNLLYVMGDVASVFAYSKTMVHTIEVEDTLSAVLQFKNGALGMVQATTSVYPGYPRRLEVSGERGTISLLEDTIDKWDVAGGSVPSDVILGQAVSSGASDPKAIGIAGHIAQIRDMVEAIAQNREPNIDGYEGRRVVAVIEAIYASGAQGKPIELA